MRGMTLVAIGVLALLAVVALWWLAGRSQPTSPVRTPVPLVSATDMPTVATPSATRTPPATVQEFIYDFADGSADGWTGSPEYWRVVTDENGRYVYQGEAPADLDVASEPPDKATLASWRDYAVEMQVRVVQPTDHPDFADVWVSMRAAYQPKVGCEVYDFYASFGRRFGTISPAGDDDICPFKRLVDVALPLSIGRWTELRVETRGDQLTMWVDGQEVLRATDDRVDAGYFYLNVAYNAIVQFADIRAY